MCEDRIVRRKLLEIRFSGCVKVYGIATGNSLCKLPLTISFSLSYLIDISNLQFQHLAKMASSNYQVIQVVLKLAISKGFPISETLISADFGVVITANQLPLLSVFYYSSEGIVKCVDLIRTRKSEDLVLIPSLSLRQPPISKPKVTSEMVQPLVKPFNLQYPMLSWQVYKVTRVTICHNR